MNWPHDHLDLEIELLFLDNSGLVPGHAGVTVTQSSIGIRVIYAVPRSCSSALCCITAARELR